MKDKFYYFVSYYATYDSGAIVQGNWSGWSSQQLNSGKRISRFGELIRIDSGFKSLVIINFILLEGPHNEAAIDNTADDVIDCNPKNADISPNGFNKDFYLIRKAQQEIIRKIIDSLTKGSFHERDFYVKNNSISEIITKIKCIASYEGVDVD